MLNIVFSALAYSGMSWNGEINPDSFSATTICYIHHYTMSNRPLTTTIFCSWSTGFAFRCWVQIHLLTYLISKNNVTLKSISAIRQSRSSSKLVPYDNSCGLISASYTNFVTEIHSFLPARRYASAGYSDRNVSVRLSVCPSVRHAPVLCQNEES